MDVKGLTLLEGLTLGGQRKRTEREDSECKREVINSDLLFISELSSGLVQLFRCVATLWCLHTPTSASLLEKPRWVIVSNDPSTMEVTDR